MSRLSQTKMTVLTLGLVLLGACESVNVEKAPETTEVNGLTLEQRVLLSRDIEKRLVVVGRGLSGLKRVSTRIGDLARTKPDVAKLPVDYSIVDLMIDLNDGLQGEFPASGSTARNRVEKINVLQLPSWSVEPACQEVTVKGVFEFDSTLKIGSMIYSLKSCETNDAFVDIASAIFVENNLTLKVDTQGLETALKNPVLDKMLNRFECKSDVEGSVLNSIECKDIQFALSQDESVNLTTIRYSRVDDVRLLGEGEIYRGDVLKARASLKVDAGGKVDFRLDEVPAEIDAAF